MRARHAADGAPNPVLVRRAAWALAAGLSGDRGLGPLLAARPELVLEVAVDGANPDVDTPADLAALQPRRPSDDPIDPRRRARGRLGRARPREPRPGRAPPRVAADDLYAPVTTLFVADPRRTGEPALDALLAMARADETWLDIGAGAGRYALPLALRVREVIAVEPSAGMRRALRTGMAEHGIGNVRVVPGTWPEALDELGDLPAVDMALIAHVGYDIESIGPFLDGDGGGDPGPLRRHADGPQPGIGRRPVLAARPRRGPRRRCRRCRSSWSCCVRAAGIPT